MSSSSFSLRHHFPCFPTIRAYAKRIKSIYTALISLFIGLCICFLTIKSNEIPSHVDEDAMILEIKIMELEFKRPVKMGIFDRNSVRFRFGVESFSVDVEGSDKLSSSKDKNDDNEDIDENLVSCHWKIVGKPIHAKYFYSGETVDYKDDQFPKFRDWNGTHSELLHFHDDRCRNPKQIPKLDESISFIVIKPFGTSSSSNASVGSFVMILEEFRHLVRIKWIFMVFLPLFCIGSLTLSSLRSFYTSFASLLCCRRLIRRREECASICEICNQCVVNNAIRVSSSESLYHLSCFVQSPGSIKNLGANTTSTPVIRDSCELIEWLVNQKVFQQIELFSSIDSCVIHLKLAWLPNPHTLNTFFADKSKPPLPIPQISLVVYNWPLYTSLMLELLLLICLIVYLSIAVVPILGWKNQVIMLVTPLVVYLTAFAIVMITYRVTIFKSDMIDNEFNDNELNDNEFDLEDNESDEFDLENVSLNNNTVNFTKFPGILRKVSLVSLSSIRFLCSDWVFQRKKDLLQTSLLDLYLKNTSQQANMKMEIPIYSGRNGLCGPILEHLIIRLAEIHVSA